MKRLAQTLALLIGLSLLTLRVVYAETIPLKKVGGTYVVPVLINGKIPLDFTLDTGATEVTIPADVFGTLLRTETVSEADLMEPHEYELADGSVHTLPRFRIRTLKVGNLELRNVVASVAPARGSLLLGQSFLARLRTWSVDNQRHVLVLNEGKPVAHAVTDSAQYANLFDRVRAGFRLENGIERPAVAQQLRWYAANPDDLKSTLGRATQYLYYIVSELERRGMPLELALLPAVESAFDPYAYSSAHASGLWQFNPGTGSKYDLKQDWWYDGRRDIVESTRAALDYLQALHDEFDGDWLIAVAAYNCTETPVERAVETNNAAGKPVDFWHLALPCDTYVPKLLAMKRLVQDPKNFGLAVSPIPNQPYFVRVPTGEQINLRIAAEIAGISPDELYELNPAFHRWATDPSGPHFLLLPVKTASVFAEKLAQLSVDQRLGVTHYFVKRGDSLATVARKFQTSVNVVRELNDMPTRGIAVGDDLRVPGTMTDLPAKVIGSCLKETRCAGTSASP